MIFELEHIFVTQKQDYNLLIVVIFLFQIAPRVVPQSNHRDRGGASDPPAPEKNNCRTSLFNGSSFEDAFLTSITERVQ